MSLQVEWQPEPKTNITKLMYSSGGMTVSIELDDFDLTADEIAAHFVRLMAGCGFAQNRLENEVYNILKSKLRLNGN